MSTERAIGAVIVFSVLVASVFLVCRYASTLPRHASVDISVVKTGYFQEYVQDPTEELPPWNPYNMWLPAGYSVGLNVTLGNHLDSDVNVTYRILEDSHPSWTETAFVKANSTETMRISEYVGDDTNSSYSVEIVSVR